METSPSAAPTMRQEAELEVVEEKTLRFSLTVMRMDRVKNDHTRGTEMEMKLKELG